MGLRYGVPARSKHRPSHADQANLPLKIGALPGALPGAFGAEQVSHSRIGHERALPRRLHVAPPPPASVVPLRTYVPEAVPGPRWGAFCGHFTSTQSDCLKSTATTTPGTVRESPVGMGGRTPHTQWQSANIFADRTFFLNPKSEPLEIRPG